MSETGDDRGGRPLARPGPVAELRPSLEAILMVADQPLDQVTLASAVGYPVEEVTAALADLAAEYDEQGRGFELRTVAGGWRYYTREEFAPVVEAFVLDGQQARLTQAALETLAVVAYKQPISRARVSAIRGVNVDGVMRTLLTRGLVEEAGQDGETGANLYRTTSYFLERIGITALDDLPELAPYLPDMDDMEDELAVRRRARPPSRLEPTPSPSRAEPASTTPRTAATAPSPTAGPSLRDHRARRRGPDPAPEAARPVRGRLPPQVRGDHAGGRVEVDGEIVTRLGTKVDPRVAVIRVDGKRLPPISPNVYLVLNKPRGVVSTMSDPEGRPTLTDYVADRPERLFHVGRLDTDTSGLILLTNDGEFAHRMAHPSYEVDKTYVAEVDGEVTKETLQQLLGGVTLEDGPVTVSRARLVSAGQGNARAARSSSWSSTRAATASSAGCSTTSATRSAG